MINQGMDDLGEAFTNAQRALFEPLAPLLFDWGWGHMLEDAYAACGWFLMGLLQVLLMLLVIAPLQRWRPLEPLVDRGAVRSDVIYTLVHRLGLFRLGLFFAVDPVLLDLLGALRAQGLPQGFAQRAHGVQARLCLRALAARLQQPAAQHAAAHAGHAGVDQ